jgi:RNA polymerase sigma-70 factor, ECF subfamily
MTTAVQPDGSSECPELELIRRILAGEKRLFHDLIRPYERTVYFVAYSVLQNREDAEEVQQESMMKAFLHLGQLQEGCKFKSWLLAITMNEANMRLRKDRKFLYEQLEHREMEESDYTPRQFADWRELPSDILERTEVRNKITQAIDSLPLSYRSVFVLRDMEHLGVQEAASALGITPALVKVRLHRARLKVREQLAPVFQKRRMEALQLWKGRNPWLAVKK